MNGSVMNGFSTDLLNFGPGLLLEGRKVLVSGIGPGMGRDISLLLARHGARLAIASRTESKLISLASEIEEISHRPEIIELDIADRDSCRRASAAVKERLGGLDILVNNAFDPGDFRLMEESDLQGARRSFDINFFGTLQLTQSCIDMLKYSNHARIIMINTMSTTRIEPRFGAYSASKAALASATKSLAVELGPYGIRVNGVHPGFIWGESNQKYFEYLAARDGISPEEQYRKVADQNCLGYIPHSSEIVGAVLFLASDLSNAMTGQALGVNCGQVFQAP